MTTKDKLEKLKYIFRDQVDWYKKATKEEGEDYVYDMAYEQFNAIRRGDWVDVLAILDSEII